MVFDGDPYRTLGLARDATLDEVKRAYRRLAKANHPDAAGAGALARFLAIQAAYEHLLGVLAGPGASARRPGPAARRPAAADPERADATRRAYGGRPRGRRRASETGPDGPAAGGDAGSATAGPGGGRAGSAGPRPRGKATLGSTSYDDADAGPFEPDWGGASWYGTTSGTYWTINPKEYADPRKHGPEYQARARRASSARQDPGANATEPPADDEPNAAGPGASSQDGGGSGTSAGGGERPSGPTHTTASWWESTASHAEPPREPAGWTAAHRPTARRPADTAGPPLEGAPPDPARAAADLVRALIDPHAGGLRGRLLRAFVGWLPIAFGLGWLFGELTGCGRFSATCDPSADPLVLAIQGAALVALVLVPDAGSIAAGAALGLLAAAVATALVLSATGTAADEGSRQAALGILLVVAWLAGLVIAVVGRLRSPSSRAGPVS